MEDVDFNDCIPDSTLADNCIVKLREDGDYYCAICVERKKSRNWYKHITDAVHVSILRRFDLIFERRSTGFYCKACNVHLQWGIFDFHAVIHKIMPWYQPQKIYRKFVENHVTSWGSRYYCWLCDSTFSEFNAAAVHLTEAKHQTQAKRHLPEKESATLTDLDLPYELLVANGIVVSVRKSLQCKICECWSMGPGNVKKHVTGRAHKSAKLIFLRKLKIREDGEDPRGISDNQQREENPPAVVAENPPVEAEVNNPAENNALPPVGRRMIPLMVGGDNVNPPEVAQANPPVAAQANALVAAQGNPPEAENLERDSLEYICISAVAQGLEKYFCKICKLELDNKDKLWEHFAEKLHILKKRKFGCDEVYLKGTGYFCNWCNVTFADRSLASDHIESEMHLFNVHLRCLSVTPINEHKYRCKVCDADIFNRKNLRKHIEGSRHKAAEKVYACDKISRQDHAGYHCELCNFNLLNRKLVFHHINEEEHLSNVNNFCISIRTEDINKFRCILCNIFSYGEKDISAHLKGKRHVTAREKHGCQFVAQRYDNHYYCTCCDIVFPSRQFASYHITEKNHLHVVSLPTISIVTTGVDKYRCTMCNVDFCGQRHLSDHLKEAQHMVGELQYGCVNISVHKGNDYHCKCCNVVLSSRQLAIEHMKEERHIYNANLPCITVSIIENSKYHCEICGLDIKERVNLERHIKAPRHATARRIYSCDKIWKKSDSYYCQLCDISMLNQQLAFQHLREESHRSNANTPCISIKMMDVNKLYCNICKVSTGNTKDTLAHVAGELHEKAKEKYGCYNVSPKDSSQFYCSCCDCTFSNRDLAADHLTNDSHIFNANLPCISVVRTRGNQYRCIICSLDFSSRSKAKNHVDQKEHVISKRKHGCEYVVKSEEGSKEVSQFYCDCCYLTLQSRQLASIHLIENTHLFNSNLPCISVTAVEANKYLCTICSLDVYGRTNLEEHVMGISHSAAQRAHGCDFIVLDEENIYHCDCCNSTFTDRQLASKHVTDTKHKLNANLPCSSIVITDTDKYECTICGVDKIKGAQLDDHLKEKGHVTARKKYGCDEIIRKEGNLYYCGCCDVALSSRQLVTDHLKQESHMSNANWPCVSITMVVPNEYHCVICNTDSKSKAILMEHMEGKRHKAARRKYGCDSVTRIQGYRYYCSFCDIYLTDRLHASYHIKEEMHIFNGNLPCISVKMKKMNEYYCTICDVTCTATINISHHIKGRRHAIAQSKYGCKYIYLKEDYWYYCTCCDSTLMNHQLVLSHLKQEWHVISANLPCLSITLVNPDCFNCTICNIVISGAMDLRYHVRGRRHEAARMRHGCSKISLQQDKLYLCECCNVTFLNRTLACGHLNDDDHVHALERPKQLEPPVRKASPKRAEPLFQDSGTSSYCAVCDCQISGDEGLKVALLVREHIRGREHSDALKKFADNGVSVEGRSYFFCRYCCCEIVGFKNVGIHITGKKHETNVLTSKAAAEVKEEKASKSGKPSQGASKETIAQPVRGGRKKAKRSKQVHYEKVPMVCPNCKLVAIDTANLHSHMTQHLTSDCNNSTNGIETATTNGSTSENGENRCAEDDCPGCSIEAGFMGFELYNRMNDMEMEMREIIKDLDFDAKYIYTLKDKEEDFELGMKLCFQLDLLTIQCFVCMQAVRSSMTNYYKHLCTPTHCNYLDEMENDHQFFSNFPDKLSQMDLAVQYMQDVSDSIVHCFACNHDVRNFNAALWRHISSERHARESARLEANAAARREDIVVRPCDWYDVDSYWCVPCSIRYPSEYIFAQHLESEPHKRFVAQYEKTQMKTKLIFDFCAQCALLWYGYRSTWSYHTNVSTHPRLNCDRNRVIELSTFTKRFLSQAERCSADITRYHDQMLALEHEKEAALLWDLEKVVKPAIPEIKIYTFGSRVCRLASADAALDVFLDCGQMYNGDCASSSVHAENINKVHASLMRERQLWEIYGVGSHQRPPMIEARHIYSRLYCHLHFDSGLPVETTRLMKSFIDAYPPCRELIHYLKQWLRFCDLAHPKMIPNYTLYWCVIFYLQIKSILPSIASLIAMQNESRLIGGWEVGVSREFTCNRPERDITNKELLAGFFRFYAHFDYRQSVACPLLGEIIAKRAFADPESLPEEMKLYKVHVRNRGYHLGIDSVLCIQDPFDLHHNISKSVSKFYLCRFRKYCLLSLSVLGTS